MRIRRYFDEDSARHSLARDLGFRGADVLTAIEAGMAQKTDEEQLEWAAAHSRVVYSFMARVIADTWDKLGPAPEIDYDRL